MVEPLGLKHLEEKRHGNYTKMLYIVLNKATAYKTTVVQPFNSHLANIQVRWTRHAQYCWRSKDELISELTKSYTYKLYADTGFYLISKDGLSITLKSNIKQFI